MTIAVAFALLVALLLWLIVGARGYWPVKLALIVALPIFALFVWRALDSYKGYPAAFEPPNDSVLLASVVREPSDGEKGAVWLWLVPLGEDVPLLGYKPGEGEPRAYRLPYSRPLHEQVDKGTAIRRRGGTPLLSRAKGQQTPEMRVHKLPPPRGPKASG